MHLPLLSLALLLSPPTAEPQAPPLKIRAPVGVELVKDEIKLAAPIRFEVGSLKLKAESLALLDEVAKLLIGTPDIKRVQIEAHTDSRGSSAYNLRQTEGRAEAVRRALVERGVSAERLVTRGYGEERPIAPNTTAAGRAQNRRIELRILKPE